MADLQQMAMLLELEQRREDEAAANYAQVQQQVDDQRSRLEGLSQYRLDYLQQLQQRGSSGIVSRQFGQYHAFVGKLDEGVEQLHRSLVKLQQVADQRRQQWLAQRRKKESIKHLITEQQKREEHQRARREQKNLDDFSSQRFIREMQLKARKPTQ
ncbi:flagellar export protein FliJ [Idiomarina sp. OT37-5b]|jgi:flagellar FliJ protein|uniref:Flagellar FliJ protein n=1 Tax=Idiomarina aquatica TaxID=1327752 RepID=A0AA94EFD9_9GAMM|nr:MULTISPECIES: flagellar export protein FliJ [Idiomarina]AVJ56613.1 flagellar export protein FliJ [Idiomarina sp. OT37-5b]RUO42607.1 flagellar export protein FliJ [Idiomarina aquatica]